MKAITTRTQLRDSLKKVIQTFDEYENLNTDRHDFLQGKYADYIPIEDDVKDCWKTDGEFCVLGWLAVTKDIEFPHYIHDLKKTGYVFKGETMVSKFDSEHNKIGEEPYKYYVDERACECELHTQQDDESSRDDWIDDDYVDEGIAYADLRNELVPEVDKYIHDLKLEDEYKEYLLEASIDLEYTSSRGYGDSQRFTIDLIKAYNIPHVLLESLQMINDTPSFSMLHSLLGDCGHGYTLDERYAVDEEQYGTEIKSCQRKGMTTDLGGWKKPVVDYLKTELVKDMDFDSLMECNKEFSTFSNVMLKAFINWLLTSDKAIDYYMSSDLQTETDSLVGVN